MRSMTAFASAAKRKYSQNVQVILRSLNYKYLDVFVHNLPPEKLFLEDKIKKEVRRRINRGRVEVYVFIKGEACQVRINEKNFMEYVRQITRVAKKYKLQNEVRLSEILSLPQVVCLQEKDAVSDSLVMPTLRDGLKKLLVFKAQEGRIVEREMRRSLGKIKTNVAKIEKLMPLAKSEAKENNNKEDIAEEVSLMSFYVHKLEKCIDSQTVSKGKTLDFLTQEILRELNAASSKTAEKNTAACIVECKSYLERIREQAQNVE